MAKAKAFHQVKLICGIIAPRSEIFDRAQERLETHFGPIDLRSSCFAFDLTDYYEAQMGKGLKRTFLSFSELISPESLDDIKLQTNGLEETMRVEMKEESELRIVNLDPGIITTAALIMATTKDFSHRVPLRNGIYAHLEFLFSKKGLKFLDWTYPDFRSEGYQEFFRDVRRIYLRQMKSNP